MPGEAGIALDQNSGFNIPKWPKVSVTLGVAAISVLLWAIIVVGGIYMLF